MSDAEVEINRLRRKVARATNAMHPVSKNTTANLGEKRGSYSYANIEAVLHTVKAALQEEGVALQQPFTIKETDPPVLTVDTVLTDAETGTYIMYPGPGFPVKGDPQACGGAITYFRRYALVALFGLIVDDDDAQQATHAHKNPGNRSEAETNVRSAIAQMSSDDKQAFVADFKDTFGMGLSELPVSSHEAALSYTNKWINKPSDNQTTEGDI